MHYLRIFSKIGSKLGVKNGNVVQKNVSSFVHLYRVLSIGGYDDDDRVGVSYTTYGKLGIGDFTAPAHHHVTAVLCNTASLQFLALAHSDAVFTPESKVQSGCQV